MHRRRRRPPAAEPSLMAHLRARVWGPAEFVGPPPWWLLGEGLLAGILGAGAIVGTTVAGAWTGTPALADGEAGLVCAAALVVYLAFVRAGRALVGIVAVLGVCLALLTPQGAAGLVLAQRGEVQKVVVTSVEGGPGTGVRHARYLCSVTSREGVPLTARIWRGCERSTRPGDVLAVVYDPEGRVPPRGVAPRTERGPLLGVAASALALVLACAVAVVRSFRLGPEPSAAERWPRSSAGPSGG